MPIYEFLCQVCTTKFSFLAGMTQGDEVVACKNCGSTNLTKLVSRVGKFRSEATRIDDLLDSADQMGELESGSATRAVMREAGKVLDDDMADEMEQMFELEQEGVAE
jgi:putative FmdB family regulatory protein